MRGTKVGPDGDLWAPRWLLVDLEETEGTKVGPGGPGGGGGAPKWDLLEIWGTRVGPGGDWEHQGGTWRTWRNWGVLKWDLEQMMEPRWVLEDLEEVGGHQGGSR